MSFKWDGTSRVSNKKYRSNWNDIFNKKPICKNGCKDKCPKHKKEEETNDKR